METEFKGLLHLSRAEYTTLSTTGTLTKGGQTYTFDPLGTEYVVPKEASGGGVTMDLLWEKAGQVYDFFAGQRIDFDVLLSDYDFILVEFNPGGARFQVVSTIFRVDSTKTNQNHYIFYMPYGGGVLFTRRQIDFYPNYSYMYARDGEKFNDKNDIVTDNYACVPTRIYGIKL